MRKIYYNSICATCTHSIGEPNNFYCTLDNECKPAQETPSIEIFTKDIKTSSQDTQNKEILHKIILESIDYQISNLRFSIRELENLRESIEQLLEKGEDYSTIYDTIYYNQFYKKFK